MTEPGGGHHEFTWGEALQSLAFPVVNFTIFAIILYVLLRGPLVEYFRVRAATLREALDTGAKAQRDAEELRNQLEQDLADLPRLRDQLKTEFVETAERQRNRLLDAARAAAARIRRDAEASAAQEAIAARVALRTEVASTATAAAMEIVRAAIRPDDHDRFVREFVDEAQRL